MWLQDNVGLQGLQVSMFVRKAGFRGGVGAELKGPPPSFVKHEGLA